MIQYGRQDISPEDIAAVVETLRSPFLTQGPKVREFERALLEATGARHAVAVANGTAALHLAVLAAGLAHGDEGEPFEGITTGNTFAATANALLYADLLPVFADIDPCTYNIDPEKVAEAITTRTRYLIPVHFAGQPADMKRIGELARGIDLTVIEDASHAIGSTYVDGDLVGSCRHSDMTTFSFHPVKTITTGEGGAITTNSDVLAEALRDLRSHGITKDPDRMEKNEGPWYYEMSSLGYNYRLSDLHAALGLSQLTRLGEFKTRRREIVSIYNEAFQDTSYLTTPYESKNVESCFHLYVVCIDYQSAGTHRGAFMEALREKGVGSQVHYVPVYHHPYYRKRFGDQSAGFPENERYYREALSLPLYPTMTDADVGTVVDAVKGLLR